jgi:plasmid stabilization system protein ParE
MPYRIVIDRAAQSDIDQFYAYLRRYSEQTALKYLDAFYDAIETNMATMPKSFPYFKETGAPYRAFLFTISRRTTFWIIYTVDDRRREVRLLRFWNTAREPGTHGLIC